MTPSPLRKLANHLRTSKDDVLSFGEYHGFSMRELVVSGNYEDFATDFCEFVEAVKKNESVTTLKLEVSETSFRWGAGFWLFNTLCRHLPNAKTLQIEQHCTDTSMLDSALLLRGTERFEDISLKIRGDLQLRYLKEHSKLQILDVEIYRFTTSLVSIAEGLMPLSNLKEVVLSTIELTDNASRYSIVKDAAAVAAFLQRSSLRKLDLSKLKCTNGVITDAFARGISASSIQDLTVDFHARAGASQIARIREGIVNCTSLQKVSMVGDCNRRIAQLPSLMARLLRSNQELSSLKLGPFETSREDLQALAGVLRDATRPLTALCLDSFLPPEEACLLLAAARESTHLERLKVSDCASSPEWERRIRSHVEGLCDAPCLRELSVNSNVSLATGAERNPELSAQLVERFCRSFTLECISVDWLVDDDSVIKLNTICTLNKAGRHYLKSRHPSKSDGVEVLAKHCTLYDREMLNFLYTHLRENPSLCSRHCDDHDSSQDGTGSSLRSTSRQGTKRPLEDAGPSTLD